MIKKKKIIITNLSWVLWVHKTGKGRNIMLPGRKVKKQGK